MGTPIQMMTTAWRGADRAFALPRVTEELAAAGVSKDALELALGELLEFARSEDTGEESEEIILELGDRLHGWCSNDRRIHTKQAAEVHSAAAARPISSPESASASSI